MEIIPAIDLIDGKCVRLTEGDYAQKTVYHEDPLDMAKKFEDAGLVRLHIVDLDGAKAGKVINHDVLDRIVRGTSLTVDYGGGIKTRSDLEKVFLYGARWATVGTIAVKEPERLEGWLEEFGPDRFLLGADVRGEKVSVSGWLENTDVDVFELIRKYKAKGISQVFCTDISRDGKLQGPSIGLYRKLIAAFPGLRVIASGGVSRMDDLQELRDAGCAAVIIGKAIYENRITLEELRIFIHSDHP